MVISHYITLGVSEVATSSEIRKAYYKLAQIYHPDKNPTGTEKFKEIANAYSILSDQSKKAEYDLKRKSTFDFDFGSYFRNAYNPRPQAPRSPTPPPKPPPPPPPPPKRSDYHIYTSTDITLKQAYLGVSALRVYYSLKVNCQTCHGASNETRSTEPCLTCNGKGSVETHLNDNRKKASVLCSDCKGAGHKSYVTKCQICQGAKAVRVSVSIPIEKGIHSGHSIKVNNYGNLMPDNVTKGDLFIKVSVEEKFGDFQRQGDNLHATINIKLRDALMGINRKKDSLKHLDGSPLMIHKTPGTVISPGMSLIQHGEGMPIFQDTNNKRGDLHIVFNVIFPETINIPGDPYIKEAIDIMFETEEEREIRENTIVIEDDDDDENHDRPRDENDGILGDVDANSSEYGYSSGYEHCFIGENGRSLGNDGNDGNLGNSGNLGNDDNLGDDGEDELVSDNANDSNQSMDEANFYDLKDSSSSDSETSYSSIDFSNIVHEIIDSDNEGRYRNL